MNSNTDHETDDRNARGFAFDNANNHNKDLSKQPYRGLAMKEGDPLMLQGDQSYMFWDRSQYREQADAILTKAAMSPSPDRRYDNSRGRSSAEASSNGSLGDGRSGGHLGGGLRRETSAVSALSSDDGSEIEEGDGRGEAGEGEVRCTKCGSETFKARVVSGERRLECGACGRLV